MNNFVPISKRHIKSLELLLLLQITQTNINNNNNLCIVNVY